MGEFAGRIRGEVEKGRQFKGSVKKGGGNGEGRRGRVDERVDRENVQ